MAFSKNRNNRPELIWVLVGLLLVLPGGLLSQEMPKNEKGKYEYQDVVNVDGATKEQVFRTARAWCLKTFNPRNQHPNVIYTDDSYLGEIAANPLIWINVHSLGRNVIGGSVSYSMEISVKDGKYRFDIYNFYHESNRSAYGSGGALENETPECGPDELDAMVWSEIKADFKSQIEKLISDLKEEMNNAALNAGNDW